MSEDWTGVAHAINQRLSELGMRQRELAERSHVSQAIVRELQHNSVQRRRSTRTLEALSLTLGWHAEHLSAVLEGRTPPKAGEPLSRADDDVPGRLDAIEHQLRRITDKLDEMNSRLPEESSRGSGAGS